MTLSIKSLLLLGAMLFVSREESAFQQQSRRIYVCMDDLTPSSTAFLKAQNIPVIKIVYAGFLDSNFDDRLDEDVFLKRIEALFPDKNASGMGVLDWEAKGFEALPVNSPRFSLLVNEYHKAVLFAKKQRPNVKWGFYGLPFRRYMSYNADWRNRNMKLIPLLQDCDFLAPSLYSFFPDSIRGKDNQDYVKNNVSMALQIGTQLNKPVYPFIWNRWHEYDKKYALQLIPVTEFKRHVNRVLSVNYQGKKVAGVIWWNADNYFFNRKSKALLNERARYKSFDSYKDNTINVYTKALKDIFRSPKK